MLIHYTTGDNPDFVCLCCLLDDFLNAQAGGEQNRAQYLPHNQLQNIHDVVIAYADGRPVGCVGFKRHSDGCAEVKRFYVRPAHRRKGVATLLLRTLEEIAKQQGYRFLILETIPDLTAAMALYQKSGYTVIPNYGQYKDMPDSVCMQKQL